ncbi:hypothetical protein ABIB25_001006 [Nakamurella sp. UYEF19]
MGTAQFRMNGKKVVTVTASKGTATYVLPASTKVVSYKVITIFVPASSGLVVGSTMARPIALFTGQWADLPFEKVAELASG